MREKSLPALRARDTLMPSQIPSVPILICTVPDRRVQQHSSGSLLLQHRLTTSMRGAGLIYFYMLQRQWDTSHTRTRHTRKKLARPPGKEPPDLHYYRTGPTAPLRGKISIRRGSCSCCAYRATVKREKKVTGEGRTPSLNTRHGNVVHHLSPSFIGSNSATCHP